MTNRAPEQNDWRSEHETSIIGRVLHATWKGTGAAADAAATASYSASETRLAAATEATARATLWAATGQGSSGRYNFKRTAARATTTTSKDDTRDLHGPGGLRAGPGRAWI